MLASVSLEAEASSSIVSDFLQPWQMQVHRAPSMSSCSFLFSVLWKLALGARLRVLRHRVVAGLGAESSSIESCDTDVKDVLVDELEGLVDKPGTTMGT